MAIRAWRTLVLGCLYGLGAVVILWNGLTLAAKPAQTDPSVITWPELTLTPINGNYDGPVQVIHAGDDSGRLFVVERPGVIRVVQDDELLDKPFLDISERVDTQAECGLLSMAFPPDYGEEGYFYVYYNHKPDLVGPTTTGCDTVVARFYITSDPNVADEESEERILVINQPLNNHNGGQIVFGPDGYLYIGLGDGGGGGDPLESGQSVDTLLGKLLRLDVESEDGDGPDCGAREDVDYRIPSDNPLADGAGGNCDEIWAYGLRNPWRFSFDRATGDLYIGDVGQGRYEEIDMQPASSSGGENYGWNVMEGTHCYKPIENCNTEGLTLPIWEYGHDQGSSVSGGMVYRGAEFPRMEGIYFYADFTSGRIWGLQHVDDVWHNIELVDTRSNVAGFGEDEAGNMYMVDLGGTIYRLGDEGEGPTATATPPTGTPTAIPSPTATATPPSMTPTITVTPTLSMNLVYLPAIHQGVVQSAAPEPPPAGSEGLLWDPRLDQRGATLIPAGVEPGVGYWKLIKAEWFDVAESGGRHHIFVDVLDESGARQTDVPVLVRWPEGTTTITTAAKPGEAYAADFGMFSIAPAYAAAPNDGAPADTVDGMGMGTIQEPFLAHHTSYGLVWQWTVAENSSTATTTPRPTGTPSSTPPPTAIATTTSMTPTLTVTPTLPITATATGTPTATPTPQATPENGYFFSRADVAACEPLQNGTRFEGHVYVDDAPAGGYRVVFSHEADGVWATQPALSDAAGFYAHIIGAGVARSGNWFTWIVDADAARISAIVPFHTDGPGGACNLVTIDFRSP